MPRSASPRIRPVNIAPLDVEVRHGEGGTIYLKCPRPLGSYPPRITDALERWAAEAPDRTFLAQRDGAGGWRRLTYGEALGRVRAIAQALVDRELSVDRPIVILSGNSIEHALVALAAMYVGVPYAPIAPAYSLQARDFGALRQVFDSLQPALVFADDGPRFDRAIEAVLPPEAELVVSSRPPASRPASRLEALAGVRPGPGVDRARDRVGPDTIAKILFTSGSTGRPKGVINTQRMLCANQEMIRTVLAFLADEPPVLCDWLPWNHTAGGNHNFGIVLYNGGTLYIDEGKPTPEAFGETLRNLREIPAVAHFTVPRTYEMLLPHLRRDGVLRDTFFRNLKIIFYAAAGLGQRFWEELREVAAEACGEELLIVTGFGATETAPFALCTGAADAFAGMVGLPVPGLELKLATVGDKLEARVRGPNVTPGYWRDEALTAAAFDEEGFYRTGDAMRFVDPADPAKGLLFDGRLAEDFKLSTGTWVSVGPLRARILAQAAGCAQDVVLTGHDREFVGALIFPNLDACRELAGLADAPAAEILSHPRVVGRFQDVLDALARESTGSSTRIARAMLLEEPPSLDAREITDKGSINQKAVLRHRAALVEELYAAVPSTRVLAARPQTAP
ncbi:MAG TPA: feruloyl-CoA synthase [Vicinamibacterales bacterium]|nr:feruloyl-CoA synthase [Vicinamibacterales bacterium]